MQNPGRTLGSRQKVLEEKLPHLKQVDKHDSRIVSTSGIFEFYLFFAYQTSNLIRIIMMVIG